MKLNLIGNDYLYECQNLIKLFFPECDLSEDDGNFISVAVEKGFSYARISYMGKNDAEKTSGEDEWSATKALFSLLSRFTGKTLPWGMLTGVRPVKLVYDMIKAGKKGGEIREILMNKYLLTEEKMLLCYQTAMAQKDILLSSTPKSVSVYAGIPFCPTRCKYCSFICEGVEHYKDLIPVYADYLCREIELTGEIIKDLGLTAETVYVGGGTPTTLPDNSLEKLISTLNRSVGAANTREFTVEAGRPDTVSEEKLRILKDGGVGRISINPQTLNDDVLKTIGRDHTVKQFYDAFSLARKVGDFKINVDLIAGLTGDNSGSFRNTVNGIIGLSPDNITLHTLTLKRAADMYNDTERYAHEKEVAADVGAAEDLIRRNGYFPYYLYRQKNTVGGLENTGFSKVGAEGLYNIFIMDETHSILACGAGASSKIVNGRHGIDRCFNYKFPREYINGFPEILSRKEKLREELKSSLQIKKP